VQGAEPRTDPVSVAARGGSAIALLAFAVLAAAALVDVTGTLGVLSGGWPRISHALTVAGLAAGLIAVLLRVLTGRRGARRARRATTLELIALGVLLGAWRLRGHPAIPPDPPLLGAALIALLLLAVAAAWRRRLLR
jgi:uncharacterized membrane protein